MYIVYVLIISSKHLISQKTDGMKFNYHFRNEFEFSRGKEERRVKNYY